MQSVGLGLLCKKRLTTLSSAVDGCIHRAAGPLLTDECRTLQSCETGKAKITCGYRLPAKYVIHTVGPIAHGEPSANQAAELRSCYLSSLDLMLEHRLRSAVDRLIICVFLEKDENIYRQRLPYFFPVGKYPVVRPWPAPAPPPSTLDRFSLSSAFQPDGTPPPTLTRTGKQGLALCVAAH
ncbi:hypothetical protein CB1_120625002 [Camelus ferus]|nr:hypothetical protein CB1_120625002 [Camelus ferus]